MSAVGKGSYGAFSLNLDGAEWRGVSELFIQAMRIVRLSGIGRATGRKCLQRIVPVPVRIENPDEPTQLLGDESRAR
jgi:hypothetical protein